jgi:hypothetical protein
MSTSPRSKPASASSPETGDAPSESEPERTSGKPELEIDLEVSRQRFAAWTVFGIVVGSLLVWKLGTVGVWAGFVLIAVGLYRGFQLAQTFMNPVGTIKVSPTQVTLPRGLCLGKPVVVTPDAVTAVYFLRRSVPWHRTAPVLIVELGQRAMVFPRDWFASEADQRHVVHALMKHRPAAESAS